MKKLVILILAATLAVGVALAVRLRARVIPTAHHQGHAPSGSHHVSAVYYCPMHPTYTSDKPGSCPICNMTLVKREPASEGANQKGSDPKGSDPREICVMHNCPMAHDGRPCPMTVVAKSGEEVVCPICGTHLAEAPAKVSATAPEGYAPVRIAPHQQQLIGVTTAVAARRAMTKTIRAVGRIAYDPELYQTQQEYVQALRTLTRAHAETAPDVVERSQQLVEAIRLRLRLLGLSPELIEEVGRQDGPDRSLLLTDPSGRAWLYAAIYEFELPLVTPGQTVTVEVPAAPGKTFTGVVRAVDPVLDPMTRTARVRATLTDPDGVLKPEMYVNASLRVPVGDVVAVPDAAVFQTGTRQIVFVDQGGGRFEPRQVTVGATAEGFSEIREGVAEGEPVVTSGNFLIDSESRLKAALEGMSGSGGHHHGGQ